MEVWHFEANQVSVHSLLCYSMARPNLTLVLQPITKSTNRYQYILANGDTTGYGLHADLCVLV